MRAHSAVIASVLVLTLITGCNREEEAEQDVAPTPMVVRKKPKAGATPGAAKSPAATAGAGQAKPKAAPASPGGAAGGNVTYVKQTLGKLNGYLPAAVKALQGNDVATAKQYAQAFTDNWQQKIIQNTVKTTSQQSYNQIAAGVKQVNSLMQAPTPDKTKATAALQSLSQNVAGYVQSSQ
jgi:3',5'-cyclic AMP phosphodiesterase CpdA